MMIRFIPFLIFSLLIGACSEPTKDVKNIKVSSTVKPVLKVDTVVESSRKPTLVNYKDSLNYTDSIGRKQGIWEKRYQKGRIIERGFYIDDLKDGEFWDHRNMEATREYKMGVLHGYSRVYYDFSKGKIMSISKYENGEKLWSIPQAALKISLIPIKGIHFHTDSDSMYIRAPFPNGNLFYEGWVFHLDSNRHHESWGGTHKMYHENGKVRMIANYPNATRNDSPEITMELYDSLGNRNYNGFYSDIPKELRRGNSF